MPLTPGAISRKGDPALKFLDAPRARIGQEYPRAERRTGDGVPERNPMNSARRAARIDNEMQLELHGLPLVSGHPMSAHSVSS